LLGKTAENAGSVIVMNMIEHDRTYIKILNIERRWEIGRVNGGTFRIKGFPLGRAHRRFIAPMPM
jgi:hypothetical protein